MKFIEVDFSKDITNLILENHNKDNTLFLFPTVQSRNLALKRNQDNWQFSNSKFETLEDWKYSLFEIDKPLLKEEKRSLAWFLSLEDKHKELFRITDYFSSIDMGNKFFSFWEEINEELIAEEQIHNVLEQKSSAENWQKDTFEALIEIKHNYNSFIKSLNFEDKIFAYNPNNLVSINKYTEVILINQFYLTNLEKHLLRQLDDVIIYHQFPAKIFDKDNLSINQEITAEDLINIRNEKINEIRSGDDFSMICSLFNQIENKKPNAIIDFRFDQQSYANFFSQKYFPVNTTIIFSQTSIYRFFFLLRDLISNAFYYKKKILIPLQTALDIFSSNELIKYFSEDYQTTQTKILNTIYLLAEDDFQYIDFNLECLRNSSDAKELKQILRFCSKVYQIDSMEEFNSFIDSINPDKLITAEEKEFSNLLEQFEQIKSDFKIINELNIVQDWNNIFLNNRFSSASLKLFLDYMQPKVIKQKLIPDKRISITTLQDTRNLLYDTVYVMNVTEGVLPPKRKIPFLLSENQRNILGLKTFDDIRNREKYYFYRLLAQAKEVVLFTIENLEENKEISSFAEELRLHFKENYILENQNKYSYHQLYQEFLGNRKNQITPQVTEDFHKISFEESDFPNKTIKLSYYKWQDLQDNPFEYFIKHQINISERKKELQPQTSAKLIGNITHEIFNIIWQRIIELYQGNKIHHNFYFTNQNYANDAFKHLFAHNKDLLYKMPHNYSQRYFDIISLPILKSGIMGFFKFLDEKLKLSDQFITVLPEKDKTDNKIFTEIDDYQILLRGKADFRIETDSIKYIFDYKTGSSNSSKIKKFQDQLIMYEELYYLIEKKELQDAVKSYLYFVEDQKTAEIKTSKKVTKAEVISDFETRIKETIRTMIQEGFTLGEKASKYEILEITRRDLFKNGE